ncbi:oxygen-independent coproporphyrinogen III oxidase hemN [Candidatus Kinetoplastibacterium desouzaii TCC079E]|uniref:Heme chaperone HemW n=1 Tax=Candidatus Kinetoplastidibacterium desouzai TCC079E TaxID=1208919 RepID=M1L2D2_9PROT|nr:radical SAM family heme chaperone HemW [Candidatus Kinetoplastibacterium desouzaii]AGF46908.1 oxygen-independent coproporphyrinogen III oxidase hemN [Candidatus Kinetoplastibacterium desouzaii TCC079E]
MNKIIPIFLEKNIDKNIIPISSNINIKEPPPLSLYIHVPWCVKKCPYCDFNSHAIRNNNFPEEEYIKALSIELKKSLHLIWGRTIISVYIGGGTPSILKSESIDKIIEMLRTHLNLNPLVEITIEINPGTLDSYKIKDYIASGINRISIGAQSFDDNKLKRLGRIHNSYETFRTIDITQSLINNINIDIMFALPGQNIDDCLNDVRKSINLNINHLSLYNLTIEKNTFFDKHTPNDLPDEDLSAQMQDLIEEELKIKNILRYEVSAYAKNNFQSIHNLNYWNFGDYLGIGPGAHSKLSFKNYILRKKRIYNPDLWIKNTIENKKDIDGSEFVQAKDIAFEFMLNALRLKKGIKKSFFEQRTGMPINSINKKVQIAYEKKLLEVDENYFRATPLGWRFLNDLQEIFL